MPRLGLELPSDFADALGDAHARWLADHPEVRRQKGSVSMTRWVEAALRLVVDELDDPRTKATTGAAIADLVRPDARRRDTA